jgi:hypothetical protein
MSTWMVTITGREHHLSGDEVQQQMIDIYDIAWSLSQINRFTGHAMRPYSVAEHSLFVAELAERDGKTPLVQLACLLHDAHEAFTNDLSSPAKNAIGVAWGKFEALQADRVRRLLGVNDAFRQHGALIQYFDLQALATERLQLTNYNPRPPRALAGAGLARAGGSAVQLGEPHGPRFLTPELEGVARRVQPALLRPAACRPG